MLTDEKFLREPFEIKGLYFEQSYPCDLKAIAHKTVKFDASLTFKNSYISSTMNDESKKYSKEMIKYLLQREIIEEIREVVREYDTHKYLRKDKCLEDEILKTFVERKIKKNRNKAS